MSLSAPSLQGYLRRLGQRIQERRGLLTLERTPAEIRAKAVPLADRGLENCITFGTLALILFVPP